MGDMADLAMEQAEYQEMMFFIDLDEYVPKKRFWNKVKKSTGSRKFIWTDQTGRKIPVNQMTDSHLRYAHRWLNRILTNDSISNNKRNKLCRWSDILFEEICEKGLEPLRI